MQKKDINLPEEVFNIDENGVLQGFQSDFFNPDSEIYKDNFKNCNVLQIPTRVTSINAQAFYVNNEATGWHTTIPEHVTKLTFGEKCNLSSLGSQAFSSCSSITSVDFSQCINLTATSSYVFQYCTSLTSVIFPSNLKTIGGYAFSGCSSLKSINFSNCPNLTNIERYAFENCSSIQEVDFSNNKLLNFFSGGIFQKCPSIKEIKIDNDYFHILSLGENGKVVVKKEETSWTDTSKIQGSLACGDIVIPDGITSIGNNVFSGCSSITSLTLPSSLKTIGYAAFSNCTNLSSSIDLSNCINLSLIDGMAFQNCSTLTSVIFPSSLSEIGNFAFTGCSSLNSVNLLKCSNLSSIGDNAFAICPSIKEIKIDNDYFHILSLGENGKVVVKKEETSWTDTSKIQGSLALGEIVIPNGITSINSKAFIGCSTITSISFLSPLSLIGNIAFASCTSLSRINWNFTNEFNDVVIEALAFSNICNNNCKIRCTAPNKHTSQALLDWLQDKDGGYASPKGKFPTSGWEAIN